MSKENLESRSENSEAAARDWDVICGDAVAELQKMPTASVDLVFTDPPYPKQYQPVIWDVAAQLRRVLKPDGRLVVMTPQYWMPQWLSLISPHIRYRWVCGWIATGQHSWVFPRKIGAAWKPLLVFGASKIKMPCDVFKSKRQEKEHYRWQQSCSATIDVIRAFSNEGDMVIDPFLGAGTTGVACVENNRRFIGIENDKSRAKLSRKRIREAVKTR